MASTVVLTYDKRVLTYSVTLLLVHDVDSLLPEKTLLLTDKNDHNENWYTYYSGQDVSHVNGLNCLLKLITSSLPPAYIRSCQSRLKNAFRTRLAGARI